MLQRKPLQVLLKEVFLSSDALSRLILINSVVWVLLYILGIPVFLFSNPLSSGSSVVFQKANEWLAVPASVDQFLAKPWTAITYMFFHQNFFHIFFNMYVFWFFGKIFRQFFTDNKLYVTYLTGGLTGAIVFIGAYNLFPVFSASVDSSIALGASASVLAVVVFTALKLPEYRLNLLFIGELKLLHLAIAYIIIDVLMIPVSNSGGHFAHIGGAFAGGILVLTDRIKLNALSFYFRRLRNKLKTKFHSKATKPELHKTVSDEEFNRQRAHNQTKTDAILEKISKSGYSSLSKEEKEFLFKQSSK